MFPLCRPEPPLVTHTHKHAHLHAYAVLEAIFTKFSLSSLMIPDPEKREVVVKVSVLNTNTTTCVEKTTLLTNLV